MFRAFTLAATSGFSSATVPGLLVPFGAGLLIGNALGARAAECALITAYFWNLGLLTVVLVAFALTEPNWIAAVVSRFLTGMFGFVSVPGFGYTSPIWVCAGTTAAGLLGPAVATALTSAGRPSRVARTEAECC